MVIFLLGTFRSHSSQDLELIPLAHDQSHLLFFAFARS